MQTKKRRHTGLQSKRSLHYTKQEKKWIKTAIHMYLIMTYLVLANTIAKRAPEQMKSFAVLHC